MASTHQCMREIPTAAAEDSLTLEIIVGMNRQTGLIFPIILPLVLHIMGIMMLVHAGRDDHYG